MVILVNMAILVILVNKNNLVKVVILMVLMNLIIHCKFDDSGDFCNSDEFYNSGESGKSGKSGDLLNRLTDGG